MFGRRSPESEGPADPGRREFLIKGAVYTGLLALGVKILGEPANRGIQVAAGTTPVPASTPSSDTSPAAVSRRAFFRRSPTPGAEPAPLNTSTPVGPTGRVEDDLPVYDLPLRSQPMYMNRMLPGGEVQPKAHTEQDCIDHILDPKNTRTPEALKVAGVYRENLTGVDNVVALGTLKDVIKAAQDKKVINRVLEDIKNGGRYFQLDFFYQDQQGHDIMAWQPTQLVDQDLATLQKEDPQAFDLLTKLSTVDDIYALVVDPKTHNSALMVNECDNVVIPYPPRPKATNTPKPAPQAPTSSATPTETGSPTPTSTSTPKPGGGGPGNQGGGGGPSGGPTPTETSVPGAPTSTPTRESSATPQPVPPTPTRESSATPQPVPPTPVREASATPQGVPSSSREPSAAPAGNTTSSPAASSVPSSSREASAAPAASIAASTSPAASSAPASREASAAPSR